MTLHASHVWARHEDGADVLCLRCGARPHWPLAERSCTGKPVSRHSTRGAVRISADELHAELGRALDMCAGGAGFRCIAPNLLYGRDGRRGSGRG